MLERVCVFAASSDAAVPVFGEVAAELGRLLGAAGMTLVYGAGKVGLMGSVARGVHEAGGHVIGVIPVKLNVDALTYRECDELVVTDTIPLSADAEACDRIRVLSCAQLLAETILRINRADSVSSLFVD